MSLFRSVSALLLHISSSTRSSFTYFCTEPQSFYCQLPLGVRGWLRELEYIVEKFYLSKETEDELYESLVDASLSILHHSVDTVKLNRILLLEQIRPKYQCSAIPLNYAFTMVSFVLSVFEKRKLMDAKFEGSQVFRRTVFLGHLALFLKPSAVTQDNFVSHLLASQWISWLHRNQPSWTGIASHLSQWNSIRDIMGPIDRDVLQNHLLLMLKDLKNDVLAHTRSQPLDGIRRAHSAQMSTSRRNLASTTPLESDDNSITKSSLFLKQLKEGILIYSILYCCVILTYDTDGFDVLTRCQALYISLPRSDIKTELKELIHAISDFFKAHPSSLGQSSQVHCSTLALLQSLPSSDVGKRGILSPQKPRRGMQSVLSSGRPSSRIPLPFPPTTAIHRIRLEPLPGIDPGRSQSSQDSFSLHSTDQKALDSRTRWKN